MSRLKLMAVGLLLAAGFSTVPAVLAQRDAGSKFRGEFGTGFDGRSAARGRSAGRAYRYAPPVYVRRAAPSEVPLAPARPQVAEAPTQRRAFSVVPSLEPEPAVEAGPAVRFYEPAPRAYSAPRARRSPRTPTWFLPKTDPRRFGG